jgi:hypothetical protein
MSGHPSWNDLEPQPAAAQEDRLSNLCAMVFTTLSGKELLAELRRKHFDTGGNPLADDRALRVRATQQHFVRELELARDRGLKANTKPK